MLMPIVMQVRGKIIALFTPALVWLKERLLNPVSNLRVSFSQAYQSVVSLLNQLVQIMLKCKVLVANLITQVQLIKVELTNVKTKVTHLGLLLQTIVAQIRQLVPITQKQKNDKLAEKIKLVQSHIKENKIAKIHTAALLTPDGLKSQGHAKQRHQRAKHELKKGK